MSNRLEASINTYMLPKFESAGLSLNRVSENEALFVIDDIQIAVLLDRDPELYATISATKLEDKATLSDMLNYYIGLNKNGSFMLSENFSLEAGLNKLADVIITEIIPLIHQDKIVEALKVIVKTREHNLQEYYEKNIDADAETAFDEKRYIDVVTLYRNKKTKLTETQEKRLSIALRKIEG